MTDFFRKNDHEQKKSESPNEFQIHQDDEQESSHLPDPSNRSKMLDVKSKLTALKETNTNIQNSNSNPQKESMCQCQESKTAESTIIRENKTNPAAKTPPPTVSKAPK